MPPRRSKRGAASATKPTTRAKSAASRQEPEPEVVPFSVDVVKEENEVSELEVPSSVIEDIKVSEPVEETPLSLIKVEKVSEPEEVQSSVVDDSNVQQPEILLRHVEDVEATEGKGINQVVEEVLTIEVSTMKSSESEEASPSIDDEKVVIKEEVSVTTVVETKVIEEIVEERNLEVASEDVELEVKVEESEPEEEYEEEDEPMEDQEEDLEEETEAAEAEDSEDENAPTGSNEGGNGDVEDDKDGSDDENEEDEDPSAYMPPPSDRKKQKEFEIFVGGLDKGAVEEDLIKVFGEFGEIKSARIVKHPTTQKSKGFAFIRYATVEQAKKVLAELKDGTEVRGKRVGISPSQDSDTLYIGNICKTWKKDQVLDTLKSIGIELMEEIYLPDDPKNEGKSRGFALLEFNCHSDAMAAFQLLRKPDAVFGCDKSAKVAFAQSSIHPSEESLSQVKTVFVEGLTDSWDEQKLQEFCKQYGVIEKIQLSRKLVTTKRKDFGFVSFRSRESAVACVEGINSAQIEVGDIKVKANLAKPQYKGRLGKQAARGGYKIKVDGTEEAGSSQMKGQTISKGKGKSVPEVESAKGSKPSKPQPRAGERQGTHFPARSDRRPDRRPDRTDHHRPERPGRGGKRGGRNQETDSYGRPSKKQRGSIRGRPSYSFDNRRNNPRFDNVRHSYSTTPATPVTYVDPYAQVHAPPASSYQGHSYGAHPGSKRSYSDMAPHAGFIEPSPIKQGRVPYGYESYNQRRPVGYIEPSTTKQGRVPYGYESYDPRRPVGYGGQASSGPGYGGSMHPPPSYAPSRTSYAGYQAGSSSSGTYVYPNAGAYPPPPQGYYYDMHRKG